LSWKSCFDDPIDPPDGRQLVTLEDAGAYITKSDQQLDEWQTAIECLMLVVKLGRPNDVCAHRRHESLERDVERVFDPSRRQALGTSQAGAGERSLVRFPFGNIEIERGQGRARRGRSWRWR
jgi:hypothetical protein